MTIPGPVDPTSSAASALRPVSLSGVTFTTGFLGDWQRRNADRSLPYCVGQLETHGALVNLRRVTGEADGGFENMWFADSDVYKTLEDADLRNFLDTNLALLSTAKNEAGYLHSYLLPVEPEQRWTKPHWSHELY